MAAYEERTRQEMKDLETWIDETEKRIYVCASKENETRNERPRDMD